MDFFVTIHADFLHVFNTLMKLFFISSETLVLYFMLKKYRATYDSRMDSFRISILLLPSAILAFFVVNTHFCLTIFQYICEVRPRALSAFFPFLIIMLLTTFLVCLDLLDLTRSRRYFAAIVPIRANRRGGINHNPLFVLSRNVSCPLHPELVLSMACPRIHRAHSRHCWTRSNGHLLGSFLHLLQSSS